MINYIKAKKTYFLIFSFTAIHIVLGTILNLTDDGAYYWLWSRHLSLSYYDHPPMIAYLIRISTEIFGNNNFSVRLVPVISVLITSIFIYKIIIYLYNDEDKGFLGVLIFNVLPIFSVLSLMSLPDLPLMVFYTIALYYFIKMIYEKEAKYWYIIGLLTGLGLLSKYNMFLIYPGIFFYLLINKEQRYWLKKKEPYLGFVLSLLIFSPVIIWNMKYGWASFAFQLVNRHSTGFQLHFDLLAAFIVTQFLLVGPFLFFAFFQVIIKQFKKKDVKLLAYYGLPVFLIFFAASLFTTFKLHWTALAYIPFIILFIGRNKWGKRLKVIGIGFALVITVILYGQSVYPFLPIKPSEDITTDFYGWDRVGREVEDIYNSLDQDEWFLFSNRYQLSAQLQFYLPDKNFVYSLSKRREEYDYWQDVDSLKGKNGIFVTHTFYKQNPAELYKFDMIEKIDDINIYRAGIVYRTFYIYKCYNFKGEK